MYFWFMGILVEFMVIVIKLVIVALSIGLGVFLFNTGEKTTIPSLALLCQLGIAGLIAIYVFILGSLILDQKKCSQVPKTKKNRRFPTIDEIKNPKLDTPHRVSDGLDN